MKSLREVVPLVEKNSRAMAQIKAGHYSREIDRGLKQQHDHYWSKDSKVISLDPKLKHKLHRNFQAWSAAKKLSEEEIAEGEKAEKRAEVEKLMKKFKRKGGKVEVIKKMSKAKIAGQRHKQLREEDDE
jgi:hypothetical protein